MWWLSSTRCNQAATSPLEYGWKEEDGCYQVVWFDGDTSPTSLDVCREADLSRESKGEGKQQYAVLVHLPFSLFMLNFWL